MNRAVVGGLTVVALIVVAAAGYYAWHASRPAPPSAPPQAAATPPQTPAPASAPAAPSFDVVRIGPSGEAVIAGRAAPGDQVTILDGDNPLGTVTADPRGEWLFIPPAPLPPGNHQLSLVAKPSADGAERKSEGVVVLVVPEPNKNVAGAPSTGSSGSLAVEVPRSGQGPARALQIPGAGGADQHRLLFLDVIQYDAAGALSISGRAPPAGRVLLYLQNKPISDVRADPQGIWNARPNDPVPPGRYVLRADLVDAEAKVVARVTLQFRRVEVPAELAGNQFVVIQPGNNLWRIAQRNYGSGVLFTEIYDANRAAIEDPNLIYPDQVVTLPPR